MGYKHLTNEEKLFIKKSLTEGLSNANISLTLNRNHVVILREIKRNSIDGEYKPKLKLNSQLDLFEKLNVDKRRIDKFGGRIKSPPLSLEERMQLQILKNQNYSIANIAKLIGRSKNCVTSEFARNGGRKLYNAREAQSRALKEKDSRLNKLRVRNREIFHPFNLTNRVTVLEQQIEVLTEIIKELGNGSN